MIILIFSSSVIGKISSEARNEMILISDVLGLEALVDSLAHERFEKAAIHHRAATMSSESADVPTCKTSFSLNVFIVII